MTKRSALLEVGSTRLTRRRPRSRRMRHVRASVSTTPSVRQIRASEAALSAATVHASRRIHRETDSARRHTGVYFLAFLNRSRGQPECALTARLAASCTRWEA